MTSPVSPSPISPLPPAPLVTDSPEVFDDKAFPFADALATLQAQINAQSVETNQNAVSALESALAAEASVGDAADQVTAATAQANAAAVSRDQASTSASTASTKATEASTSAATASTKASQAATSESNAAASAATATSEANRAQAAADSISSGPVTSVNGKTGVVVLAPTDIAAAATQVEMVAGTESAIRMVSPLRIAQAIAALGGSSIIRSARSSNTMLVKADNGKLISLGTPSNFTQSFDSVSSLGSGWWVYIQNLGPEFVTLDPFGSQNIDSRISFRMYPGEIRLVQCDGVELRSIVLNSFYYVSAISGTFINPPGYKKFMGDLWGGGASGQKSGNGPVLGGGGGSWAQIDIPSGSLGDSSPFVIAASAPGATSNDTGPTAGNISSFGGVVALGGVIVANPNTAGRFSDGTGGAASISSGRGNLRGGAGGAGFETGSNVSAAGGTSIYGGAGGANGDTTSGGNGVAPGGGGGATRTGPKAGDGARGELRLWGIF